MNLGHLYYDDKNPIWCWDECELFKIVKRLSYTKLKESFVMFSKIIEITDEYLNQMDDIKRESKMTITDIVNDKAVGEIFGRSVIESVEIEYRRGVSRNKRAKEMINILAIEIKLWEVLNESQNNPSGEDEQGA